jgi:hypothetical protein
MQFTIQCMYECICSLSGTLLLSFYIFSYEVFNSFSRFTNLYTQHKASKTKELFKLGGLRIHLKMLNYGWED